jgi:hypothetical protein
MSRQAAAAATAATAANNPQHPLPHSTTYSIGAELAADSPAVFLRITTLRQTIPVRSAAMPGTTLPDQSSPIKRMPILTALEICFVEHADNNSVVVKAVSLAPLQNPLNDAEVKCLTKIDGPTPVYRVDKQTDRKLSHGQRIAEIPVRERDPTVGSSGS